MNTILVPLDGSAFGEHALPTALALARRGEAGLALALVHHLSAPTIGVSGEVFFDPALEAFARAEEERYLEGVAARVRAAVDAPVRVDLLEQPVERALLAHADDIGAGLIVMTTHGRGGLSRAWIGSVTDRIIRQSPTPVLVLHPHESAPELTEPPPFRHILIALDGSPLAERAIEGALALGRPAHARYTLVQAVVPVMHRFVVDGMVPHVDTKALEAGWNDSQAYLRSVAEPLRAEGHVVDIQSPVGQPAEAILRYAEQQAADLIALTTRGHGGLTRLLLGSVADKLLRGAAVPLLISHPSPRAARAEGAAEEAHTA